MLGHELLLLHRAVVLQGDDDRVLRGLSQGVNRSHYTLVKGRHVKDRFIYIILYIIQCINKHLFNDISFDKHWAILSAIS